MANAKAAKEEMKAETRAASTAEVNTYANEQVDEEEYWGKLPTGKKFYISQKNIGKTLEGYLVGADMHGVGTDRPFLSYTIRTTKPVELTDQSDNKIPVEKDELVSIIATSALKGEMRDAALDPEHVIKVKLTATRVRPFMHPTKGACKYIDFDAFFAKTPEGLPKKFPRASIGLGTSLLGGGAVSEEKQLEQGS